MPKILSFGEYLNERKLENIELESLQEGTDEKNEDLDETKADKLINETESFTADGTTWEFDEKSKKFSKKEIDDVIEIITDSKWIQVYPILLDDRKVKLEEGGTYTIDQLALALPKRASESAKRKFLKNNKDGYRAFNTDPIIQITADDVKDLTVAIADNYNVYNFFNTTTDPFYINKTTLFSVREEIESSNIYDRMAAKQFEVVEYTFKFKLSYDHKKPVTIRSRFLINSSLSMQDIVNFM